MHIDGHFTPGFFFEQPDAFKTTPVGYLFKKPIPFYSPWSCQSKLNLNQQFGHLDLNFQRFLHFLWINGVIVRKLKTDIIGLSQISNLLLFLEVVKVSHVSKSSDFFIVWGIQALVSSVP